MKASKSVRYLCWTVLTLGFILAPAMSSHGQGGAPGYPDAVQGYDPREVALVPHYCIFTQLFREHVPGGNNTEQMEQWYSIMGPSYNHMHHYCWGLMKINRANLFTRTQQFRLFYLEDSVKEFDYVIRNATPDFVMLPEILTKKGEVLVRLGRGALGILDLLRAIELKPDYWPPYAPLSDYYKEIGDLAKAREVLEKGLSASPNAKALMQRLAELDGLKDKRKISPRRPDKPLAPEPAAEKTVARPDSQPAEAQPPAQH
jgi:tetratricopeptide (TPR) repeat protein